MVRRHCIEHFMKQIFTALFLISIGFFIVSSMNSCANIVPPGGGPRDSLPPRLVTSIPKDSALNVSTQKITLTFDEYVEVKDVQEQLIVSPIPKNQPVIDYKLRNVTIKLRDSLEPNTTYSLNFGNSIKDVNESNAAKNFVYVFSTGNKLDNNSFSGKVILAETGKIDSTMIVVLHKNLSDTAIIKNSPRYYAKLKGDGSFMFNNLPNGKFNVFAITNNYYKRYEDSTSLFAFLDSSVEINSSSKLVILNAFEESKKKAPAPTASQQPKAGTAAQDKRLRYTANLEGGRQDLLNKVLRLDFNKKLTKFDSSKIILTDTSFKPITGYTVSLDTGKTKVSITSNWKQDMQLRLLIQKDAMTDSAGTTLTKADTIKFSTKKEAEYGSVKLRFNNLDTTKNPVLQIVRGNDIVESIPLKQREFYRKLFVPGEYELRILFDTNKNGIWDAGNYNQKKQPEIVKQLDKKLALRANWDNENDINMPNP
jgi:hypothetical protein